MSYSKTPRSLDYQVINKASPCGYRKHSGKIGSCFGQPIKGQKEAGAPHSPPPSPISCLRLKPGLMPSNSAPLLYDPCHPSLSHSEDFPRGFSFHLPYSSQLPNIMQPRSQAHPLVLFCEDWTFTVAPSHSPLTGFSSTVRGIKAELGLLSPHWQEPGDASFVPEFPSP